MNKSIVDLRTAALQLSNYQDSDFVETDELNARVNEAASAYFDLVLSSRETYFRETFPFSLAGGIGGNTVTLPSDLYKVQGLDWNPGTSSVQTVPTLPSFRERNSISHRSYEWAAGSLTIYPPNAATGNYELIYTPLAPVLADPVTVATTYPTTTIATTGGSNAVDATLTLADWFFSLATFDGSEVDKMLGITGAAEAGNNGLFLVQAVNGTTDLRTSKVGLASESFGPSLVAKLYTGPFDTVSYSGSNHWTFNGVDFSDFEIGASITVAGSATADGTYTITYINDSHSVDTDGAPAFETFAPGVTVTYQPIGTIYRLPDTMQSGGLWIELFTAISIVDKAEQDSTSLQGRLAVQTKRIKDALRWKQDEPKQVPLVRNRRRGWWC